MIHVYRDVTARTIIIQYIVGRTFVESHINVRAHNSSILDASSRLRLGPLADAAASICGAVFCQRCPRADDAERRGTEWNSRETLCHEGDRSTEEQKPSLADRDAVYSAPSNGRKKNLIPWAR